MIVALSCFLKKGDEGAFGVGDDAHVGGNYIANLMWVDIDVDELAGSLVDVQFAGVAIGKATADAEDDIGFEKGFVADRLSDLNTGVACIQRMFMRQSTSLPM